MEVTIKVARIKVISLSGLIGLIGLMGLIDFVYRQCIVISLYILGKYDMHLTKKTCQFFCFWYFVCKIIKGLMFRNIRNWLRQTNLGIYWALNFSRSEAFVLTVCSFSLNLIYCRSYFSSLLRAITCHFSKYFKNNVHFWRDF